MPASRIKILCGYNGRYVATRSINQNAAHINRKSVKTRSSDCIDGLVECYLMAIGELCNIDGIAGGVGVVLLLLLFVEKSFFVAGARSRSSVRRAVWWSVHAVRGTGGFYERVTVQCTSLACRVNRQTQVTVYFFHISARCVYVCTHHLCNLPAPQ